MSALLLLGFVLAFGFHLVPLGISATGWRYLLYDVKMLFFRSSPTVVQVAGGPLEQMWRQIEWDPALFALLALVVVVAAREAWRTWRERAPIADSLALLGLGLLAFVNTAVAVRDNFRDLVWTQVLALVVILAAAPRLLHVAPLRWVTIGLLAFAGAGQLAHGRHMVARLETNFNLTGFREDRWFEGVLPLVTAGDHLRYTEIMRQHYGEADDPRRRVARRAARRHAEMRQMVDSVLQEPGIDLRRIGVLSEGFPLWVDDPQSHIEKLPATLREAIVIDPTGITGAGLRFTPELVREPSGLREKISGRGEPGSLALLPRSDLRVFLVFEESGGADELPQCARRDAPAAPRGSLVAGGKALVTREITTYCTIAAFELPRRHAVVILPVSEERAARLAESS